MLGYPTIGRHGNVPRHVPQRGGEAAIAPGLRAATDVSMNAACLTGRFQPLHNEHLRLMYDIVERGEQLIIGVTNPTGVGTPARESAHRHRPDANPLTFVQRTELIGTALCDIPHHVIAFDLDAPAAWTRLLPLDVTQVVGVKSDWERAKLRRFAAAGYRTRAITPQDLGCCSSRVRAELAAGSPGWKTLVP